MYDEQTRALAPAGDFRGMLERALNAGLTGKRPFALVLVDLHPWMQLGGWTTARADEHLRGSLWVRLRSLLRPSDSAALLEDGKFALLLSDVRGPEQANLAAERVLEAASPTLHVGVEAYTPLVNVGLAVASGLHQNVDDLMADARSALRQAREAGATGVAVFDENVRLELRSQFNTLQAAVNGRKTESFTLHFQPIVDLTTGRSVGAEALIRWKRTSASVGSIADLISIAEKTGHIRELGGWVLQEACREARAWAPMGIRTSVNASPFELNDPMYVDTVATALETAGLGVEALAIEVTESAVVSDRARSTLRRLKDLGIGIWLDDFGSGYASLGSLVSLPIDVVKLDRSLLTGLPDSSRSRAVAEAICAMAHALDLAALAEGVETQAERDAAQDCGCDLGQGYLIARPGPTAALMDYIDAPDHQGEPSP